MIFKLLTVFVVLIINSLANASEWVPPGEGRLLANEGIGQVTYSCKDNGNETIICNFSQLLIDNDKSLGWTLERLQSDAVEILKTDYNERRKNLNCDRYEGKSDKEIIDGMEKSGIKNPKSQLAILKQLRNVLIFCKENPTKSQILETNKKAIKGYAESCTIYTSSVKDVVFKPVAFTQEKNIGPSMWVAETYPIESCGRTTQFVFKVGGGLWTKKSNWDLEVSENLLSKTYKTEDEVVCGETLRHATFTANNADIFESSCKAIKIFSNELSGWRFGHSD